MKNAKVVSAAVMTLAMLSAFAGVSTYASDEENRTVITQSDSGSGAMTATLDVPTMYTVTIPAGATIAETAENAQAQSITAENVMLENGQKLVVKLTGAGNGEEANADTFTAKNGESVVTYNIFKGVKK